MMYEWCYQIEKNTNNSSTNPPNTNIILFFILNNEIALLVSSSGSVVVSLLSHNSKLPHSVGQPFEQVLHVQSDSSSQSGQSQILSLIFISSIEQSSFSFESNKLISLHNI